MNLALDTCPICNARLAVTRLHCDQCDTTIEGQFLSGSGPFSRLTPDQVNFVLTFIKCEGRFNRMEDELSLSYPTIRNRLYDVMHALGYEPAKEETAAPSRLTPEERMRILDELSQGKITAEQATARLQGAVL